MKLLETSYLVEYGIFESKASPFSAGRMSKPTGIGALAPHR